MYCFRWKHGSKIEEQNGEDVKVLKVKVSEKNEMKSLKSSFEFIMKTNLLFIKGILLKHVQIIHVNVTFKFCWTSLLNRLLN